MQNIHIQEKLKNVINISKIVTLHYFEFRKDFVFDLDSHDFWEMVYIDSGIAVATSDDKEYVLKSGEVIFHKPNEFHRICADGVHSANVFIVTFVSSSKSMAFFANQIIKLTEELKKYISLIIKEGIMTFDMTENNPYTTVMKIKKNSPIGGQQLIKLYLEQLLIMLIRYEKNKETGVVFSEIKGLHNPLVKSIIELLENNIYGKITVDEICTNLNYSRAYLSKVFKKSQKCTINDYYMQQKIKEAKKLIRNSSKSISQISDMLCFDNPQYFSRVFKKYTNMTPREYRNSVY